MNDNVAESLGGVDKLLDQLGFNLANPQNAAWLRQATRGGMTAALCKLDGLATALRAASELADELDEADVAHVADQRALRVVLLTERGGIPSSLTSVKLSEHEQALLHSAARIWREGFGEGLRRAGAQAGQGRYRKN